MYEFITQLPNSPIGWIGLVLAAIAGGFSAYLIYNRQKDGADDRLITILKETVDQLEVKVNKQSEDIEKLTKKITSMEHENEVLVKVLQGRDDQTQQFYKQAFEAMKIAHDTHNVVTTLAESIKNTNDNMAKLIELLSKHADIIDHAAQNVTTK